MKYYFKNSLGLKLAARLVLPSGRGPFPTVVFSHGFDSSKESPRSAPLAQRLAEKGIASFLLDFTGHGESEGGKAESTIEQQTDDLKNALDFVQDLDNVDKDMLALHGSSSGALVALNLSLTDKRAKTAVLRAPRTDGYFPSVKEQAQKLELSLLFIQGEADPLATETRDFIKHLKTEAELAIICEADHLFTDPLHLEQVFVLTLNWFEKKLKQRKAA